MTDKTEKPKRPKTVPAEERTHVAIKPSGPVGVRAAKGTLEENKAALERAYVENYSNTQPSPRYAAQQAPFLGMLKNLYEVRAIQPTKLTPEVLEEVIERLWTGETLSAICMDDHIPAYKNLCKFMETHPDVEVMIEKAKVRGTHALVDAMVDIINGGPLSTGDKIRDAELVKIIKWMIGKRNHAYYGDQIKVTHESEQMVFVLPDQIIQGQLVEQDETIEDDKGE
jgi:hypothetical protein